MILIIGGEGSGKGAYVSSLSLHDIAYNIHEQVFANPESALELLDSLSAKQAVTCNEVGSGVIPANRHERAAREATGRLCVLLAQRAERVVRMVSGIPTTIKDIKG
jgi:adenosyl cobinamide kinase/adenosyl cobinamide phosphate guanylyltransferase